MLHPVNAGSMICNPIPHNHQCGEKQIAVELLRSELLHDIEFESWKISQTRIDNPTLREKLQADWEADDWIERKIEEANDDVFGELSAYLMENSQALRDTLDVRPAYNENEFPYDELEDPEQAVVKPSRYHFLFLLDPEWTGKTRSIRTNLHRFVVNSVLARWFELVKPDEAAVYDKRAHDYLDKLVGDVRPDFCNETFIL